MAKDIDIGHNPYDGGFKTKPKVKSRDRLKYPATMKINGERAIIQAKEGCSKREIAKRQKVSLNCVNAFFEHLDEDYYGITQYKKRRKDALASSQMVNAALERKLQEQIAKGMDDLDPEAAAKVLNVVSQAKRRDYDPERLEEGKSTENIGIIYEHVYRIKEEMEREAIQHESDNE